jgi:hypothetical protein
MRINRQLAGAKDVYEALLWFAKKRGDKEDPGRMVGSAWPSIDRLAFETGGSTSAVEAAVSQLVRLGYIRRTTGKRKKAGQERTSNTYEFVWNDCWQMAWDYQTLCMNGTPYGEKAVTTLALLIRKTGNRDELEHLKLEARTGMRIYRKSGREKLPSNAENQVADSIEETPKTGARLEPESGGEKQPIGAAEPAQMEVDERTSRDALERRQFGRIMSHWETKENVVPAVPRDREIVSRALPVESIDRMISVIDWYVHYHPDARLGAAVKAQWAYDDAWAYYCIYHPTLIPEDQRHPERFGSWWEGEKSDAYAYGADDDDEEGT